MFRARTPIQRVSRRIWLLIGGGGALFIGMALALAAIHRAVPANQLLKGYDILLFVVPVAMILRGVYISMRDWRCPYCGCPLSTFYPIPADCPRCKRDIGLYD